MEKLKIGNRVILISDFHGIGKSNPHYRSHHACEGVVTRVDRARMPGSKLNIKVDWDNGRDNCYRESDLRLVRRVIKNVKLVR